MYSGWVELRPTLNKAYKWVFQALLDIKSSLPFPLIGIDSDNGAEFINSAMLKWCRDERIQFTRTRAYRKNDNCSLCPLMNFFMPTIKLTSKKRIGSKIKKVYDKKIISPYQRLLASDDLSLEVKTELTRRFALYDPV